MGHVSKRSKADVARTLCAMEAHACRVARSNASREAYYFNAGVRLALECARKVADGGYDLLHNADGTWASTPDEAEAASLRQLAQHADAALRATRDLEPLRRHEWRAAT